MKKIILCLISILMFISINIFTFEYKVEPIDENEVFNLFDLLYVKSVSQYIIFLEHNTEFDCIEIHKAIDGSWMLIITNNDGFQTSYYNSQLVVDKVSDIGRKTKLMTNLSIKEEKYKKTGIKFRVEVDIDLGHLSYGLDIPKLYKKPKYSFPVNPEGHARMESIPVMVPLGKGGPAENAYVTIDNKEYFPRVVTEEEYSSINMKDLSIFALYAENFNMGFIFGKTGQKGKYKLDGKEKINGRSYQRFTANKNFINDEYIYAFKNGDSDFIKRVETKDLSGNSFGIEFTPALYLDSESMKKFKGLFHIVMEGNRVATGIFYQKKKKDTITTTLEFSNPSFFSDYKYEIHSTTKSDEVTRKLEFSEKKNKGTIYYAEKISYPKFDLLPKDKTVAIIPVGALEEQGPHLPLGLDYLAAQKVVDVTSKKLLERIPDLNIIIMPSINYGVANLGTTFAGNVAIPPKSLYGTIYGILSSLKEAGIQYAMIVNHHLEPIHVAAIEAAVNNFRKKEGMAVFSPTDQIILTGALDTTNMPDLKIDPKKGLASHAGAGETANVLQNFKNLLDKTFIEYLPVFEVDFPDNLTGKPTFTEAMMDYGYSGDPTKALRDRSFSKGKWYVESLAGAVANAFYRLYHGEDVYEEYSSIFYSMNLFDPSASSTEDDSNIENKIFTELSDEIQKLRELVLKSPEEGIEYAEELLDESNNSAEVYAWMSVAYGIMAGDADDNMAKAKYGMKAATMVEKALLLNPKSATANYAKGISLSRTPEEYGGSLPKSLEYFNKALHYTDNKSFQEIIKSSIEKVKSRMDD